MIKMFGAGGGQGAGGTLGQVVAILAAVAVGLCLKGAKERKTCRAVYSGTCTSGQVPPCPRPLCSPLSACSTPPAKASVP